LNIDGTREAVSIVVTDNKGASGLAPMNKARQRLDTPDEGAREASGEGEARVTQTILRFRARAKKRDAYLRRGHVGSRDGRTASQDSTAIRRQATT